jgi:hypothetical protein
VPKSYKRSSFFQLPINSWDIHSAQFDSDESENFSNTLNHIKFVMLGSLTREHEYIFGVSFLNEPLLFQALHMILNVVKLALSQCLLSDQGSSAVQKRMLELHEPHPYTVT